MKLVARPSGPLAGRFAVPGDKSLSHRALILGALAEGETVIAGLLESEDVLATAAALRAFGVRVERFGPGRWRVIGGAWRSPEGPIDCGNSGTGARLLMGAAAGRGVGASFAGDASLSRRPMGRVRRPLETMGAVFEGGDTLPLRLVSGVTRGIAHLNVPASAQVKSAVLLAGLGTGEPVEVAEPVPSRDHTEIMLAAMGVNVERDGATVRLGERRSLSPALLPIAGDPSSAAFALAAAAIVPGSEATAPDVLLNPNRSGFVMALQRMGADVALANVRGQGGETIGDVRVRHGPIFGAEFTAEEIPSMIDEIPILAVVAAFARGETRIEGLDELRHKESDRLSLMAHGLAACGVDVRVDDDALVIQGGQVRGGAEVSTEGDHRIAMAHLVLGLAAEQPVMVDEAGMIATSFPTFREAMRGIGADVSEVR
ncbi:3-phosphoshikimate 1-carboxyvinyltransferase [Sphingomonas sp. BN140010]|uniref:3-phosphoshikimate 1-carboxyvinyltransferase n=1 Tax=Sphingomonas arvum TaxID=2992113 RepID=A0ABT3JBP6_9SPHN|nr:3-phosphoshikimate 1-carboxyvinyltransferase [Sphingomonas sp. BN140010]MCW3796225.1 3-phosphoshikimate 1-carboxyvinyltransferase [Sphingomonas sp. BN140010]